jgi:hypothetical protein
VHHAINRPSGVELVFTTGLLPESTDDHRKAARYSAVRMACLPPNYITSGTPTTTMQIIASDSSRPPSS